MPVELFYKTSPMLKFLLPLFVLFAFVSNGQFVYNLTVRTTKGAPDANRDVVFIETSTYERLTFKTSASGMLTVTFDHGNRWLGSVGEMRNCIDLETGRGGKANRTMTYNPGDWERENQVLPDRRSIQFTHVNQERLSPMEEPDRSNSVLNLKLEDKNNRGYSKIKVSLVCFATATIYDATTTANGGATFKVPVGQNYEIDVDGVESLKWIDLDAQAMTLNMRILFQPRTFTEKKDRSEERRVGEEWRS